jgi:hypothetical protein
MRKLPAVSFALLVSVPCLEGWASDEINAKPQTKPVLK